MARKNRKNNHHKIFNFPQQSNCLNRKKFVLYNFAGKEKAYYLVDAKPLEKIDNNISKEIVAHNIIIIDRSGSMSREIEALKERLIKLLTLDEYINSQLVVTLISYSSQGDVTCHFQRIPIAKVMESNSNYFQEIKKMKVRGLTCISQALETAKSLINEFISDKNSGELTAITLHSDGYANHLSYHSEVAKLDKITANFQKMNVFINTIAHSNRADYKLLSKIANRVSGCCIRAGNIAEVYNSLYQTSKLINNSVSLPYEEPLMKGYDYQVFVSKSAKKINGSFNTIKVIGLKKEDDGIFYKYQKISQEEYEKLTHIPVTQTDESVFAFIKANLAEGNLNLAKYGLYSSLDETLIDKHAKALTNSEIAAFSQDIEEAIFQPSILNSHKILHKVKTDGKITLLELIDILSKYKKNIIINLKHLEENYQRKGLKRIKGIRDENGKLISPWLETKAIDKAEYVEMGGFEMNRNTATINMLIQRQVKLVKIEDNTPITEVAGILVNNLKQYNNYTIISDGEVNIKSLKIKINNQQVFNILKEQKVLVKYGKIVEDEFNFRSEYELLFQDLPLVSFENNYNNLEGVFDELIQIKILSSIISAHLKEESNLYTNQQLEELKKHYLSKNLYLNFPTTTEYTDLQQALNNGSVDVRISYKIDIGNTEILNLSKLYSANKFLHRFYLGYDEKTGEKIEKPTFSMTLNQGITFTRKTPSKRMKITKVDELMGSIFDNFLGIDDNGKVVNILSKVKANSLIRMLQIKWSKETYTNQEYINALQDAKSKLDWYGEEIYRTKISPLIFYIGSTGFLPDEMNPKAMNAEEITSKYSHLQISKDEKEGIFFSVGNNIITVYTKNEYYSTI